MTNDELEDGEYADMQADRLADAEAMIANIRAIVEKWEADGSTIRSRAALHAIRDVLDEQ